MEVNWGERTDNPGEVIITMRKLSWDMREEMIIKITGGIRRAMLDMRGAQLIHQVI